jgi:hypothetical protein
LPPLRSCLADICSTSLVSHQSMAKGSTI